MRSKALPLLCTVLTSLCLPVLAQEKSVDDKLPNIGKRKKGIDWATFLGPTRDSKSPEKGIITKWPREGLKVVWQRELGTGYGIGSVAKGRYYQFDRVKDQETLFCLEAETGKELWKYGYEVNYVDMLGYDGGPRCSPVIDGNRVYIYGVEGRLTCLRATDGKKLWEVDTKKKFGVVQNFFGVGSTPLIYNNLLICMVGGSPEESQTLAPGDLFPVKGNGTAVVAFDKMTGKVRYKLSDELASYASPIVRKIHGKDWCLLFARGGLLGFDPATGKQTLNFPWRAKILESVNAATPLIVDNQILITETYGPGAALLEIQKDGKHRVVWDDSEKRRDKSMQAHWNTPVYVDGHVYGSSGRHAANAELRCVELKSGKVKWSIPNLSRSSLLHIDGHLLCMAEDGKLLLFKVNSEKPEFVTGAQYPNLRYPCWAAPIVSHGLLYVRGNRQLLCIELIPE